MEEDIRFLILKELHRIGHTTEQVSLNKFLSDIPTYNGNSDLGTIKEAILELIMDGYVKETRGSNVVEKIETSGMSNTTGWKSPKRFVQDKVGHAGKIPEVYLFLTLKGKQFLVDWEKLKNESWNARMSRRWFVPLLILTVMLGANDLFPILSSISQVLREIICEVLQR